MGRIARSVAGLFGAMVLLAACSGGVDGPVVDADRGSGGEDAEVFGTLVIEGDCLYLAWTDPKTRYPVIWPHGTEWDPDGPAVVLPDGTAVHQGDEVYGGGGYHSSTVDRYTSQAGADLLSSCVDNEYGEIAVFNSSGRVEIRE